MQYLILLLFIFFIVLFVASCIDQSLARGAL